MAFHHGRLAIGPVAHAARCSKLSRCRGAEKYPLLADSIAACGLLGPTGTHTWGRIFCNGWRPEGVARATVLPFTRHELPESCPGPAGCTDSTKQTSQTHETAAGQHDQGEQTVAGLHRLRRSASVLGCLADSSRTSRHVRLVPNPGVNDRCAVVRLHGVITRVTYSKL